LPMVLFLKIALYQMKQFPTIKISLLGKVIIHYIVLMKIMTLVKNGSLLVVVFLAVFLEVLRAIQLI